MEPTIKRAVMQQQKNIASNRVSFPFFSIDIMANVIFKIICTIYGNNIFIEIKDRGIFNCKISFLNSPNKKINKNEESAENIFNIEQTTNFFSRKKTPPRIVRKIPITMEIFNIVGIEIELTFLR